MRCLLFGPNGAGKTTTIRHLMGLLKPEQGYCTIEEGLLNRAIYRKIWDISGNGVFDDMTGAEFLSFMANMQKTNEH